MLYTQESCEHTAVRVSAFIASASALALGLLLYLDKISPLKQENP